MTAIIELNNLSVQFHQKGRLVTAVKDATLHIEKGGKKLNDYKFEQAVESAINNAGAADLVSVMPW